MGLSAPFCSHGNRRSGLGIANGMLFIAMFLFSCMMSVLHCDAQLCRAENHDPKPPLPRDLETIQQRGRWLLCGGLSCVLFALLLTRLLHQRPYRTLEAGSRLRKLLSRIFKLQLVSRIDISTRFPL